MRLGTRWIDDGLICSGIHSSRSSHLPSLFGFGLALLGRSPPSAVCLLCATIALARCSLLVEWAPLLSLLARERASAFSRHARLGSRCAGAVELAQSPPSQREVGRRNGMPLDRPRAPPKKLWRDCCQQLEGRDEHARRQGRIKPHRHDVATARDLRPLPHRSLTRWPQLCRHAANTTDIPDDVDLIVITVNDRFDGRPDSRLCVAHLGEIPSRYPNRCPAAGEHVRGPRGGADMGPSPRWRRLGYGPARASP